MAIVVGKTCTKCGETKPRDEFPVNYATEDGRRAACKECSRLRAKELRAAKPDQYRESQRRRQQADPDRIRAYTAKYRAGHLDAVRNRQQAYRAQLLGAEVDSVDRAAVIERDQGMCHICSQPVDLSLAWPDPMSLTLDHVQPLSKGGMHTAENLAVAHLYCNQSKGDRIA